MKTWVIVTAALLLASPTVATFAATPQKATGYLAIEAPVGQVPDRAKDDSPMVLGKLTFNNLAGPVGLFVGGQVQTKRGLPWAAENKAYVGLEAPLGNGLTAYGFAERRFDGDTSNRYVAGVRWNFSGAY